MTKTYSGVPENYHTEFLRSALEVEVRKSVEQLMTYALDESFINWEAKEFKEALDDIATNWRCLCKFKSYITEARTALKNQENRNGKS